MTSNKKPCFELGIESLQNLQRNISNNFWKDVIGAWIDYKNDFNENILELT